MQYFRKFTPSTETTESISRTVGLTLLVNDVCQVMIRDVRFLWGDLDNFLSAVHVNIKQSPNGALRSFPFEEVAHRA